MKPTTPTRPIRVAIYTRKSTEEGLDQAFNSLEAQREAIEAYIKSQKGEGWIALLAKYDDGGFTGANTDRPAFQRLLQDVQAKEIDVVAVYKIDRLSRSLIDFTRTIDLFERHGVTFVSVTQQFNTTTSMGRLTLNILMSFAEFERQVISERTRDKMAASRRKGLWTGGRVVLGYDAVDKRLVINEEEAAKVREIFKLYVQVPGLIPLVEEVQRRGWRNKGSFDKNGKPIPGAVFDKNSLARLLKNPIYAGKVEFKGTIYAGAHPQIIDPNLWEAVQRKFGLHAQKQISKSRRKWNSPLQGFLHCGVCGAGMTPHFAAKAGRRYFYYVCQKQRKQGAKSCHAKRIPALMAEKFVMEETQNRIRSSINLRDTNDLRDVLGLLVETMVFEKEPNVLVIRFRSKGLKLLRDESRKEVIAANLKIRIQTILLEPRSATSIVPGAGRETSGFEIPIPSQMARRLALAYRIQEHIKEGSFEDSAHGARVLGISRARMAQALNLIQLAPRIQERILASCEKISKECLVRALRTLNWREQVSLLQRS